MSKEWAQRGPDDSHASNEFLILLLFLFPRESIESQLSLKAHASKRRKERDPDDSQASEESSEATKSLGVDFLPLDVAGFIPSESEEEEEIEEEEEDD